MVVVWALVVSLDLNRDGGGVGGGVSLVVVDSRCGMGNLAKFGDYPRGVWRRFFL